MAKFNVGDKVLIITKDYGLSYHYNTIQTISKLPFNFITYYCFSDSYGEWYLPETGAVLATDLIMELV